MDKTFNYNDLTKKTEAALLHYQDMYARETCPNKKSDIKCFAFGAYQLWERMTFSSVLPEDYMRLTHLTNF